MIQLARLVLALVVVTLLAALDGRWEKKEPAPVVLVGPEEIVAYTGWEPQVRSRGGRFESDPSPTQGSEYARSLAAQGDSTALKCELESGGCE